MTDRAGIHALTSALSRDAHRIVNGKPVELLFACEVEEAGTNTPMRVRVPYRPAPHASETGGVR